MATEEEIVEVIKKIEKDISGFIGASLVDIESGMTLAAVSRRPQFDLALASAHNSEMVKAKLRTIQVLNLSTTLEDMLLTLGDQIHLIKLIGSGTFLYLAADKASTNLALVRGAVNRHAAGLTT